MRTTPKGFTTIPKYLIKIMTFNFTSYNADFAGVLVQAENHNDFYLGFEFSLALSDGFNVRYYHWIDQSQTIGQATGFYDPAKNAYELISNWTIEGQPTVRAVYFPDKNTNLTLSRPSQAVPGVEDVQKQFDEILYKNYWIQEYNIISAYLINCLEADGKPQSNEMKKKILQLQLRAEVRNDEIKHIAQKHGISHELGNLNNYGYLDKLYDSWNPNISGAVTIAIVAVVITLLVVGNILILIWAFNKKNKDAVDLDFKESAEWADVLYNVLTPEQQALYFKDKARWLEEAKQAAADAAKKAGGFVTKLKAALPLVVVIAGVIIFAPKIKQLVNKKP